MSERSEFDQVLQQLRTQAPLPSEDDGSFGHALQQARSRDVLRRAVVSVLCLACVGAWLLTVALHPITSNVCPLLTQADVFEMGLFSSVSAFVCAVVVWWPQVGAQIYVRACCWSYLALGALGLMGAPEAFPVLFPAAAFGGGLSLLVLGGHGLEAERYGGTFAPVAHRTAMTWALVLASSDAMTLIAVSHADEWAHPLTNACAVGMVLATIGLFRLRAWALWLNLGLNLLVASLALTENLVGVFDPLSLGLAATAVAQLVLAAPVARSVLRGTVEEYPRWEQMGAYVGRACIVALLGVTATLAGRVERTDPTLSNCEQKFFRH